MNIANLFVYGYLPFLIILMSMAAWERFKGIYKIGQPDIKDQSGKLGFMLLAIASVIPVFNIYFLGMLIYMTYKDRRSS